MSLASMICAIAHYTEKKLDKRNVNIHGTGRKRIAMNAAGAWLRREVEKWVLE